MPGKTVVAISSTVMRGAVGLRPITFALEHRGAFVWTVPTVLLPWHPGLGPSTRTANPDFAGHLADLGTHAAEVDAVLTGYFASAAQVEAAAAFIDTVRTARPDAVVLVDPVMGDDRGRYVPDAIAEAIRALLVPRADIVTPNAFELSDLGGTGDLAAAARAIGVPQVVVTSAVAEPGRLGTLLLTAGEGVLVTHEAVADAPRGTGDLFSAVYLSSVLANPPAEALADAAAATLAAVLASTDSMLAYADAAAAIAAPDRARLSLGPADLAADVTAASGG